MPELPEVECLTRAIANVLSGRKVKRIEFFREDLRDPIPVKNFRELFEGQTIECVERRSKYMLWKTRRGYGVFHLGMSGNMFLEDRPEPARPHTHAAIEFAGPKEPSRFLHFVDPRRFGRIDCLAGERYETHAFFADLGVEPLQCKSLGKHLYQQSRGKTQAVKVFLMDARHVVGVGNIYASESLFKAGIHPQKAAGSITVSRYEALGEAIKQTLNAAIAAGGTSFRDYRHSDGSSGYFAVSLAVYDREGEVCLKCGSAIKQIRQTGRSTFYCGRCQR